MEKVNIIGCLFNAIFKDGKGAAFELYLSNTVISIERSFFSSLRATGMGAAGFISLANYIDMKFSSFNDCCTTISKKDNFYGNAIYDTSTGTALITENSINRCAPVHESGDSSLVFISLSTVELVNSTNNAGFGGASGFNSQSKTSSTVIYMNIVNATGRFALECAGIFQISKSNIINTSNLYDPTYSAIIFQNSDNLATFIDCIFINHFPIFSCHEREYEIVNCCADVSFSMVPSTQNIQTFSFVITINYKIMDSFSCRNNLITHVSFNLFYHILLMK